MHLFFVRPVLDAAGDAKVHTILTHKDLDKKVLSGYEGNAKKGLGWQVRVDMKKSYER